MLATGHFFFARPPRDVRGDPTPAPPAGYVKSFNLPVIITRGNNVYGPHQFPDKLIPKSATLLSSGAACFVHGDGTHMRSASLPPGPSACFLITLKGFPTNLRLRSPHPLQLFPPAHTPLTHCGCLILPPFSLDVLVCSPAATCDRKHRRSRFPAFPLGRLTQFGLPKGLVGPFGLGPEQMSRAGEAFLPSRSPKGFSNQKPHSWP